MAKHRAGKMDYIQCKIVSILIEVGFEGKVGSQPVQGLAEKIQAKSQWHLDWTP